MTARRKNHHLIDARARARLTQQELADLAEVDAGVVGRAERGVPIRVLNQQAIAEALAKKLGEPIARVDLFPEPAEATA